MKRIMRVLASFTQLQDDKDFWNEKATELTYLDHLYQGRIAPHPALEDATLFQRATAAVGVVSFDAMLQDLDVDTSFLGLNKKHASFAVAVGFAGVAAAYCTNLNAENLESAFTKLHEFFKGGQGASPLDYRAGAKHRYIFGHDFNIFQKLPSNYTYAGRTVGGKTLYNLVLERFSESGVTGLSSHVKAVGHILTHYLSDLPTRDGLPLPFSSLFTEWVEGPMKASGYSAQNLLMDVLGREYGTINMADGITYGLIKLILTGHSAVLFKDHPKGPDKDLHLAQMSTIAYGAAIILQMLFMIAGLGSAANNTDRTGKLNYLIALPFAYNAAKSVLIVNKQHRGIMLNYESSIAMLTDSERSFDEWIKTQCA